MAVLVWLPYQRAKNRRSSRKLTLISAPAGFGKTTLLGEWVGGCDRPVAWVSLDKGDNDPARFWSYFIAALQTIPNLGEAAVGASILTALQTPQSPPIEALLTGLINEITEIPSTGDSASRPFALVLDDFHLITEQQAHG
jgi:LuxR family maltose regulon positive regulatory protein